MSNLTIHSSRRRFAARLNSGVRRATDVIDQLAFHRCIHRPVFGWRHLHARRLVSQRDAQLTERQVAIQTALDRAGAALKDENTSLEAGEIAAAQVLQDLQALNQDGSLRELIADTEQFVEEWRASKRPA